MYLIWFGDTFWCVVSLKTSNTEFLITQFNPTLLHAECSSRSSQHKGQASMQRWATPTLGNAAWVSLLLCQLLWQQQESNSISGVKNIFKRTSCIASLENWPAKTVTKKENQMKEAREKERFISIKSKAEVFNTSFI